MKLLILHSSPAGRVPITPDDFIVVKAADATGKRLCKVEFEGLKSTALHVAGYLSATEAEKLALPPIDFEVRAVTQGNGHEIPLRLVSADVTDS